MGTESLVSESKNRIDKEDEESETEEAQRHVEFSIEGAEYEGDSDSNRPNRLHRRDTPHHLKNKRIHASMDKEKVASIIAQVSSLATCNTDFKQCYRIINQ